MKDELPEFSVGDTVDVHVKIREGEKERVQLFNGTVIRRKGSSVQETFTVRRIVQGEGVERIFPLHSPNVVDVVVKKRGRVRRAKLYYLRDRVGKGVRVREKLWIKEKTADEAQVDHTPASTAEEAAKATKVRKAESLSQKKKASADRAAKKRAKLDKRKKAKAKKKAKADAPTSEEKKDS